MRIKTTKEVFLAIQNEHWDELEILGTCTVPFGSDFYPDQGLMSVDLGFKGRNSPIIGYEDLWDFDTRGDIHTRLNQRRVYFLYHYEA